MLAVVLEAFKAQNPNNIPTIINNIPSLNPTRLGLFHRFSLAIVLSRIYDKKIG